MFRALMSRSEIHADLAFYLAREMQHRRPMYQPSEPARPLATGIMATWSGGPHPPPTQADGWLIESVLSGRTDAFAELVTPHLTSLTRLARMRLRNDFEAEDAVQQAVLLALDNLGQFRRQASFKTWISKITSNEIIHLRRGKAVASVTPLHQTRIDKIADTQSLPDIQLQKRQEAASLHRALARLPEKYRVVIELRDLHELSVATTARSLSLTVAAVKTRHHRARKLLLRAMR